MSVSKFFNTGNIKAVGKGSPIAKSKSGSKLYDASTVSKTAKKSVSDTKGAKSGTKAKKDKSSSLVSSKTEVKRQPSFGAKKEEDLQWRPPELEWKKPGVEWQPPEFEREEPDVEWQQPEYWIVRPTTQLAMLSIDQLEKAGSSVVKEAIRAIRPKTSAAALMDYLERKVKIGEVLNLNAEKWSKDTKQDFASAFQMVANKLDTMDAIVSIAILNDPDLEDEIRMENTPDITERDLLENRRIVWQYPPPGTPLKSPYLIMAAVEHRDVAEAEEIVQSIMGKLGEHDDFKIPKGIFLKLKKYK